MVIELCCVFFYHQIGCFMGFSITGCVFSGQMFIVYCIILSSYSEMKAYCSNSYFNHDYDSFYNNRDCYRTYGFHRHKKNRPVYSPVDNAYGLLPLYTFLTAANVAGLAWCLLLLSLVECFLASSSSSIYCCTAVGCCSSTGVVSTVSNYHLNYSVVNAKS